MAFLRVSTHPRALERPLAIRDAHLAALAIEWGLQLQTADRDFSRYPGLRWRDPLSAT